MRNVNGGPNGGKSHGWEQTVTVFANKYSTINSSVTQKDICVESDEGREVGCG